MQKNGIVLKAPRSFIVFFIQYLSIVPFGTAFSLIILLFLSKANSNICDIIILFALVIFFLVIGSLLLYFPQKQISKCFYDRNNKVLKKVRRNNVILTCDLNSIIRIILNITKESIGVNIKLLFEKSDGNRIELYDEQNYLSVRQWLLFAGKLSNITSLRLDIEDKNDMTTS